jgi:Ca-activated chloride channel family protein
VLLEPGSVSFGAPAYLWLLAAPAALLVLWAWRLIRRVAELRRLKERRVSPIPERWSTLVDLPLWLCLALACAGLVLALARPRAVAPGLGRIGLDLVVLQDGSASMSVRDVPGGTRWSRSTEFLRGVGNALRWDDDRMALTVFARIATPQIRLTRDPNTVFFFLDRLGARSPFRLEDEGTWDTNVEQAIAWGLRVLLKDRELHGPSSNAPVLLLVSDGETWSGEVARAIDRLRTEQVPLFVVGVGTLAGGRMPEMPVADEVEPPPAIARLDRRGLLRLAAEGSGRYFELDREADRDIANAIIDAGRRSAPPHVRDTTLTDVYWPLLAGSCALAGVGALFSRRRAPLAWQLAGALAALIAGLRVIS